MTMSVRQGRRGQTSAGQGGRLARQLLRGRTPRKRRRLLTAHDARVTGAMGGCPTCCARSIDWQRPRAESLFVRDIAVPMSKLRVVMRGQQMSAPPHPRLCSSGLMTR